MTEDTPPAPEVAPEIAPSHETVPPNEESVRLAEALVFASAEPVSLRALSQILPDTADADAVMAALAARYAGRGVELAQVAGGFAFRTAPDLAPRLRRVIEVPRRLARAAMETLAIVAYHQPVTRPEIEAIRGASLSQATMDALLEGGLIEARGRKAVPGQPTLWATTPAFLDKFGLRDLRDLPKREDLLVEPASPAAIRPVADEEPGEAAPHGGEAAETIPENG